MLKLVDRIIHLINNRYVIHVKDIADLLNCDAKLVANMLHYLHKRGKIYRIRKGIYTTSKFIADPLVIASAIYYPSYISFETALSIQNVIDQIAATIEVATTVEFPRTAKKIRINNTVINIYKIPPELMFGYRYRESKIIRGCYYYIAKPEKALLDYIYKKGDPRAIFTINWEKINKKILKEFAKKYPLRIRKLLAEYISNNI